MVPSPALQGADRVREVFIRVRAGDLAVADLYAEDGIVVFGNGAQASGRDAIRSFYQQTIEALSPAPEVESILESPPLYVAVVNVHTTAGARRAVDLFCLEGGEIQSLEIYSQGLSGAPVNRTEHGGETQGVAGVDGRWSLGRLADLEAIKQLKARYFRLTDTKDWVAFRDLFTEDCKHYLPQESEAACMSNEQYFSMMEAMLSSGVTTHHGHMPEITFLGEDEAEGIWSMFDYVQAENPAGRVSVKGYGYYYETYRKCSDGLWRISSKRNERLRLDPVPWAGSVE